MKKWHVGKFMPMRITAITNISQASALAAKTTTIAMTTTEDNHDHHVSDSDGADDDDDGDAAVHDVTEGTG